MKMETLVVTIDQHDGSLVEKMNIQTDAVVGNQSDYVSEEQFSHRGHTVTYYSTTERGVGRNRNLVMEKATAEICIFADDDMTFVEGYPSIAEKAIAAAPDADIWIFNLIEKNPRRYVNKEVRRIGYTNYGKYGAARFMVRRDRILGANISFSLLFGGGARYGSGEDTLFLKECLDKKLKIVAVPYALAEIDQEAESTWFSGYNKKFFFDKGAIYKMLYPCGTWVYCVRYLWKCRGKYRREMTARQAFLEMRRGIYSIKNSHE